MKIKHRVRYTFKYREAIYEYILNTMEFNEHKMEKEIFQMLVKGKTCIEISTKLNYSERTIQRRRAYLYNMTKDLMI